MWVRWVGAGQAGSGRRDDSVTRAQSKAVLGEEGLIMELTGSYRSFIAPMLLAVVIGTLVARTTEPRSIYDARLMDEQVAARRSYENRHHTESTRNFIRPIVRHAAPSALRKRKGINQSQKQRRRNVTAI
jgi:hypothetical protein